jgi:hypothetical protein
MTNKFSCCFGIALYQNINFSYWILTSPKILFDQLLKKAHELIRCIISMMQLKKPACVLTYFFDSKWSPRWALTPQNPLTTVFTCIVSMGHLLVVFWPYTNQWFQPYLIILSILFYRLHSKRLLRNFNKLQCTELEQKL